MRKVNGKRTGFTLIELMVVVAIIGLLTAILVPAISMALKSGTRARAMSQLKDLDGAVKRYFAEYGKMPLPIGENGGADQWITGAQQAALIEVLINETTNLNTRQIVFLDLDPASFGVKTLVEMKVALASGTPYSDPWGNEYGILLDVNFDERIDDFNSWGIIRAKSAVYSGGENNDVVNPPYKTW